MVAPAAVNSSVGIGRDVAAQPRITPHRRPDRRQGCCVVRVVGDGQPDLARVDVGHPVRRDGTPDVGADRAHPGETAQFGGGHGGDPVHLGQCRPGRRLQVDDEAAVLRRGQRVAGPHQRERRQNEQGQDRQGPGGGHRAARPRCQPVETAARPGGRSGGPAPGARTADQQESEHRCDDQRHDEGRGDRQGEGEHRRPDQGPGGTAQEEQRPQGEQGDEGGGDQRAAAGPDRFGQESRAGLRRNPPMPAEQPPEVGDVPDRVVDDEDHDGCETENGHEVSVPPRRCSTRSAAVSDVTTAASVTTAVRHERPSTPTTSAQSSRPISVAIPTWCSAESR